MAKLRPDWAIWTHMPKLNTHEAVCLSYDLDPSKVKQYDWRQDIWGFTEHHCFHSISGFNDRRKLFRACHRGGLSPRQFSKWAQSVGWDVPVQLAALARLADDFAPPDENATTDGLKAAPERTSDGLQTAPEPQSTAGPTPLTTSNIAHCFAGLRGWDEDQWKKPLGDKPKWLAACIATAGVRGVSQTQWNPVFIGAALVRDGHAMANSVRARFQSKHVLLPWLDAWKTYEADYLDTP